MNRHNKFYEALKEELDEDEFDDVYYNDEEYYEEEDGEYDEEVQEEENDPSAQLKQKPSSPQRVYTTIFKGRDADFSILDPLMLSFYKAWEENAPYQLPMSEAEAVAALRDSNYDVDTAVINVAEARRAAVAGGCSKKPLKIVSSKKTNSTAVANVEVLPEASKGEVSSADTAAALLGNKLSSKTQRRQDMAAKLNPDTSKLDCTFVIAGHVDAGKSTTLGHLLQLLGYVSSAEVECNEKQGRESHKESFKYAWLLDQSEEERRRGVTIDSGSFCFETAHRRINILDAPGHKDFVLNMISSATQADAALLVLTAASAEFEVGLRNGTLDHLRVLKTLGVGRVVVAVNKMDAVDYLQDRYNYIVRELKLLLKRLCISEESVIGYCPISGMQGTNLVEVDHKVMPWYNGPPLVELLDSCPLESRLLDAPLRVSLQDIQGTLLYAKVETGKLLKSDTLRFMPCEVTVNVKGVVKPAMSSNVPAAFAGEAIEIHTSSDLKGLYPGCIGYEKNALDTSTKESASTDFEAHIQTYSTLTRPILPGSIFTLVVHALTITVKTLILVSKMDAKGGWSKGMVKCVPAKTQAVVLFRAEQSVALVPADECRSLGRFVLQQDGETVGGGLVKRIIPRQ